eukprot:jgi/Mesen1/3280/ME000019S02698
MVPVSVPVPRQLVKAAIGFPSLPSPGSIQGCRTAIRAAGGGASCDAYVASGPHLYHLNQEVPTTPVDAGGMGGGRGGGVPRHRHEIQSVALYEPPPDGDGGQVALLGSIDCSGTAVIARLDDFSAGSAYSVCPPEPGHGCRKPSAAAGWAGLAFTPGRPSQVVTARHFARQLDVSDGGVHVRSLRTLHNPTALAFLHDAGGAAGGSPCVVVTEGPQLSLWDLRVAESGGCVQRHLSSYSGEPLYAVACTRDAASALVAVGGAERTLSVYDTRQWRVRSKWTGCLKYEMTSVLFSAVDPRVVFVGGLDYEVICGRWDQEGLRGSAGCLFAFKGDSRWCGVARAARTDVLGGWCQSGNLFVASIGQGSPEELPGS